MSIVRANEDYRCELTLKAPIASVYEALTTPAGLRGWWGTDADVATEVGGRTRFNWSPGSYTVFRIEQLTPPVAVDWICVEQQDEKLPHPDEWVGTSLSFRLTEKRDRTRLALVHHGLIPQLACFRSCERGWDFFLRHSLRGLVESGHGMPHAASTEQPR